MEICAFSIFKFVLYTSSSVKYELYEKYKCLMMMMMWGAMRRDCERPVVVFSGTHIVFVLLRIVLVHRKKVSAMQIYIAWQL